jgi:hypothetical protein
MAEEIMYYAIVDDFSTREEPAGVLRRFMNSDRRDESFGQNLEWKFSPLRHAAQRGDTQYDLIPISEDEADQVIERIQRTARASD